MRGEEALAELIGQTAPQRLFTRKTALKSLVSFVEPNEPEVVST